MSDKRQLYLFAGIDLAAPGTRDYTAAVIVECKNGSVHIHNAVPFAQDESLAAYLKRKLYGCIGDQGLDLIFDRIDDALCAGEFDSVQEVFATFRPDDPAVSYEHLIGILTITGPARRRLPGRATYAAQVRARLTADNVARLEDIMRGLE